MEIKFAKDKNSNEMYFNKVEVLLESLPYIKEYFNSIVVIKIGGSMMENNKILKKVLDDLVLMKYVGIKVVLVHGGGKQISKIMDERKIKPKFVDGLRVTDEKVIDIAKMVLIGQVNTKIVNFLNKHGKIAIGVSGNDASFISCSKKEYKKDGKNIDLGYVGDIEEINSSFLINILDDGYMPVIATLGVDKKGYIYNINADTCASEIAISLKSEKLISLTDVDGILKDSKLISSISIKSCYDMIESGEIDKGMIPKVEACINALENGVKRTHILNGTKKHSILAEIFTDKGIGTMIVKED